jgi:hypothetical protein
VTKGRGWGAGAVTCYLENLSLGLSFRVFPFLFFLVFCFLIRV